MFTNDESLEQIAATGRIVASIRANLGVLAAPNVAALRADYAQMLMTAIVQSREVAVQERLRAEGYRRVLLPHFEANDISHEDAVSALASYIQGVNFTEQRFVDIIANFQRMRQTLAGRADLVDVESVQANYQALMQDIGRLGAICDVIRAHSRMVATQMQTARLAPTLPALVNRGVLIGNMSRWLERALEIYTAQLASV